jgi:glutamate-1-semialdehyde 2,1-aminomutase
MTKDPAAKYARSAYLLDVSRRHLSGGVSSAVRADAKPLPLFFQSASGSHLMDVDGKEYLDYALAWGPLILGHSHPAIIEAVESQLKKFVLLGAQTDLEISVSKKICEMVPCAELVAFSSTGSEAVQVALRLARAFTKRRRFIRFEGHYHGWHDNVLVGYRPSPKEDGEPEARPISEGTNPHAAEEVVALPWNDLSALEAALLEHPNEIAAIITEPVLCNCNCLMPAPGYLKGMRDLATRYGALLIFDEVITGFRVAPGGAQALFGITPDLATFGKAVAGGFPLSVVAGRRDVMKLIEQRRVLHAGTFNGNPVSLSAARATLEVLDADRGAVLQRIRKTGEGLMAEIKKLAEEAEIPVLVNGIGAAFHLSFTRQKEMKNYRDTISSDLQARDSFIQSMLEAGVYLLPDGRWYVSAAHDERDVVATLSMVREVFAEHKRRPIPTPAA